ncbi:hypothetical protein [Petroclostridium xylanilyticum]|nr:hypothetical protein [Petroclostridium xylanilyticum]
MTGKQQHVWNVAARKSPWREILGLFRHGCRYKPTAKHGVHAAVSTNVMY